MKTLQILADPSSLMKNITKFFSGSRAHIQELLQNARRADATEVKVDISVDSITISDNGHGVYDPQRLITIGGSEWQNSVASEIPAGMGLFSCFQLSNIVTVRSADWLLWLNYESLCKGEGPQLREGLEVIKGTEITMMDPRIDDDPLNHTVKIPPSYQHKENHSVVSDLAQDWAETALFMPFETTISIEEGENPNKDDLVPPYIVFNPEDEKQAKRFYRQNAIKVEAFSMEAMEETSYKKSFDWGSILVSTHSKHNRRKLRDHNRLRVVTQGICIRLDKNIPEEVSMLIVVNPGEIDLRLPDRDVIIKNAKTNALLDEAKRGLTQALVSMLNTQDYNSNEERWLSAALLKMAPALMSSIPPMKRSAILEYKNNSSVYHIKDVIGRNLILTQHVEDQDITEYFCAATLYQLEGDAAGISFAEGLPESFPWFNTIQPVYERDERADEDECIYVLKEIVAEQSSPFHRKSLDIDQTEPLIEELCNINDADISSEYSDYDIILIHRQPNGVIDEPSLSRLHNRDIDGMNGDTLWEEHPINGFLMNQGCVTFVTKGNIRDIKRSFQKYAKGAHLVNCDIVFSKHSNSEITLESGLISTDEGMHRFIDVQGKAQIEED